MQDGKAVSDSRFLMHKMSNRAFSIIEALLGGILITILALGGAGFNVQMRRKMQYLQERYAAVSLASSQIEDLRIKAKDNFSTSLLDVGQDYASTLGTISEGLMVIYDVVREGECLPAFGGVTLGRNWRRCGD